MRVVFLSATLVALSLVAIWSGLSLPSRAQAQGHSNEPNVLMLDNCDTTDDDYNGFGGCPEGGSKTFHPNQGDVTVAEFLALLTSPFAPGGQIVGHPSWRNEPSYVTVRSGQNVRVSNNGGRVHTFTKVAEFGGGFVPPLNGALVPAPECDPAVVTFVAVGKTQVLSGLPAGLHKFQCCIHPWMRGAVRVK